MNRWKTSGNAHVPLPTEQPHIWNPRWKVIFLALTGAVLTMEVVASLNDNSNTDPWTTLIVEHIPGEITFPVIGGVSMWLLTHFGVRYYQRKWSHGRL